MVFPIDVGLGDSENIIEEELTKIFKMMAFPVINSTLEIFHGLLVLSMALCLVNFIGYAFGSI